MTGSVLRSSVDEPLDPFKQTTIDTYFRPAVHKSKRKSAQNQLTSISKARDVIDAKIKVTDVARFDHGKPQTAYDTAKKATISKSHNKIIQLGHSVHKMDMVETTPQGDGNSEQGGAGDHEIDHHPSLSVHTVPHVIGERNVQGAERQDVGLNVSTIDGNHAGTNVANSSGTKGHVPVGNSSQGSIYRTTPRTKPQLLLNNDVPSEYPVGDWDSTVSESYTKPRISSTLGPRIEYNLLPRYNFGKPIKKQSDVVTLLAGDDNDDNGVDKTVKIRASDIHQNQNEKEALGNEKIEEKHLPPHLRTPAKAPLAIISKGAENTQPATKKTDGQQDYIPPHLRVPESTSPIAPYQPKMRFTTEVRSMLKDKTNIPQSKPVNRYAADTKLCKESPVSATSKITSKASELSSATPTPSKGKGKVLALEAPIAGWNGQMPRGPPKWEKEGMYDNNDKRQRAHMQDWLAQSVNEASENPVQVDVNKSSFVTGQALADGQEELGGPVDPELHESYPSTDPFTVAKAGETAEDKAKAYQKKLRDEVAESKRERRMWRKLYKEREANYVPPPNPHKPKANIYVRPGEARDMAQITEMYNYYVRTAVVASERNELTVAQWRARWQATMDDGYVFLVAVIMHGKQPPGNVPDRNRRHLNETVVGFAFAEDYGDEAGLYRYTCELQFWVHHSYARVGVGKTLVDRMLYSMDPEYPARLGTPFVGGEDELKYKYGGYKIIKKILIHIPFLADDDSTFKWQAQWLMGFNFSHDCTLPDIGYKFGKQ